MGLQKKLYLGNLDAKRDWGHAKDYVIGMWAMLQQEAAEDYVLATGSTHSVREMSSVAFKCAGIELEWKGAGQEEKGYDKKSGDCLVEVDRKYFRPAEVDILVGDATKAKEDLGWEPKITFKELVKEMVEADILLFKRDKYLLDGGHEVLNYHE